MTTTRTVIAISGPDSVDKRLLAHFIAQELRRAIGPGDANLTLTSIDGSEMTSIDDGDMFAHLQDRQIELFIPNHWRVASYQMDEHGNLASVVVGISAVGEHSFRGMAKKTALRLHEALRAGCSSGLLSSISVDAVGDELLVSATTSERTSLADMTAEVLARVRNVILDTP